MAHRTLTIHTLKSIVAGLGYRELKPAGKDGFDVLVAPNHVDRATSQVAAALSDLNPKTNKNRVEVDGFQVNIKNRERFKKLLSANKGGRAEERFYQTVKELLSIHSAPLTFDFTDGKQNFTVENVVKISHVGDNGTKAGGTGTGKKADFHLHTKSGKVIPLSMKGKFGDQLASADTFWREKATKVINWAVAKGKSKITKVTQDSYKLDPPIAVEATPDEIEFAAFGTDILGKGIIMKGEMFADAFEYKESEDHVTVNCMKLYGKTDHFAGEDKVWVQMRNELGRGSTKSGFWRGIRIVIVQERNLRGALVRITKSQRTSIGV